MAKMTKLLVLLCTLFLALTLGACSKNDEGSGNLPKLVDFKNAEVTCELGTRYTPDITTVKDDKGNEYGLVISAYNSTGSEIGITDGSFTVKDINGYTVRYRVYFDEWHADRTVKVNVQDTTGPELKFLNLRKEREIGTIPIPLVHVSDYSTATQPTVTVTPKDGLLASAVTVEEDSITFNRAGTYVLKATAQDIYGNTGTVEQEIVITEKMADNVWEDFASVNDMETIKTTDVKTSSTVKSWIEEFQGEYGVARIQPNYAMHYQYGFYTQFGFSKTYEELVSCDWDYITVRVYISVPNLETVSVRAEDEVVIMDNVPVGQWVDIQINKKDYFVKENIYMFPRFIGNESQDAYYSAFAHGVTDLPRPMFCVCVGSGAYANLNLEDVVIYVDEISWGKLPPDTTPPTIKLDGASWQIQSNSRFVLPAIKVDDDRDNLTGYSERKFYKVTQSGDQEIAIEGGAVMIGGEGSYKLVVKAKDYSDNEAVETFVFQAKDTIDYSIIAEYNNKNEIGGFNGQHEWLDEFNGEYGIMKITVDGSSLLKAVFPQANMSEAVKAGYNYVYLRIYVDVADLQYTGANCFYSWNSNLGAFKPDKWVDYYIGMEEVRSNSFLTYGTEISVEAARVDFANHYTSLADLMYIPGASGGTYTVYIDEIKWCIEEYKTEISEPNTFTKFNQSADGITFGSSVTASWCESYQGENGVMKIEAPALGGNVYANSIAIGGFDAEIMKLASESNFDYIRFKVYLDAGTNTAEHYYLRNFNCKFGEILAGKWTNIDIDTNEWSYSWAVSSDDRQWSPAQGREHMKDFASGNLIVLGYIEGATEGCTLYISEITWGNYTEGAGDNYFYTFSAEDSLILGSENAYFGAYPNIDTIDDPAWYATYKDANGVIRLPLSSTGNYNIVGSYLRLCLGVGAMEAALDAGFDYIRFRVYIEPVDNPSQKYQFRNKNAVFGTYDPNQWINVDVRIDTLAANAWMGDSNNAITTVEDTRVAVAEQWGENIANIFAVDHDFDGNANLYIDYISWGVDA